VVALGHLGWVFAEDPAEQAEGDLPPFGIAFGCLCTFSNGRILSGGENDGQ